MATVTKYVPVGAQNVTVIRDRDDDLASIILTWFIQVTALAAAITFGIFSVLSWTVAETAKEQANTANLVALAALCGNVAEPHSAYNSEVQSFCNQLFPHAWSPLAAAVAKTFPDMGDILPPKVVSLSSSLTSSTSSAASTSSSLPAPGEPSGSLAPSSGFPGGSSTLPSASAAPPPSSKTVTSATSTSTHPSFRPPPTSGAAPSEAHTSELGTSTKIGLAVGLAIGIPTVLVSVLTCFRYRRMSR